MNRLFLLLPLLVVTLTANVSAQVAVTPRSNRLAVINFDNRAQGDPTWNWLSKGLADLTINDLVDQKFSIVSREEMQAFVRELELKKVQLSSQSVAQVLKVAAAVHGSYLVTGDQIEIIATIQKLPNGELIHQSVQTGPASDALALQKKFVIELIDVLKRNQPGTTDAKTLIRWTESLPASQLLYDGVDRFDHGDFAGAWAFFRRAMRADEKYADARYWAARMMYFLEEYHQAGPGLRQFVRQYPQHPRVGDALLEIVSCSQLLSADDAGILHTLDLMLTSTPNALVPNQYGPGGSSTAGIYAAGMAAQILTRQGKYSESLDRYFDALAGLSRKSHMYWVGWHQAFDIKLKHLKATGIELELPPPPEPEVILTEQTTAKLRPLAVWQGTPGVHAGAIPFDFRWSDGYFLPQHNASADQPLWQKFVSLSPAEPTARFDFSAEPLVPQRTLRDEANYAAEVHYYPNTQTYTRYFYTGPEQTLSSLECEIGYVDSPYQKWRVDLLVNGDVQRPTRFSLGAGRSKLKVTLPPNTHAVGLQLAIGKDRDTRAKNYELEVNSWRVTAEFAPPSAGTLVVHNPLPYRYYGWLDGVATAPLEGDVRLAGIPAGRHKLEFIGDQLSNPSLRHSLEVDVSPNEVVDVLISEIALLNGNPSPFAKPEWDAKLVSVDRDPARMGGEQGAPSGGRANDVALFVDREGRWIAIWSLWRDLYFATSIDSGATWSEAAQLPVPINSAHNDDSPQLMQDSTGRYLLAFASDRNLEHRRSSYICWTDDFVNWSSPSRISNESLTPLRVLERADGIYLAYLQGSRTTVCTSGDLVNWSAGTDIVLRPINLGFEPRNAAGAQKEQLAPGQKIMVNGQPVEVGPDRRIMYNGQPAEIGSSRVVSGGQPTRVITITPGLNSRQFTVADVVVYQGQIVALSTPHNHGEMFKIPNEPLNMAVSTDGINFETTVPALFNLNSPHPRTPNLSVSGVTQINLCRDGERLLAAVRDGSGRTAVLEYQADQLWRQIATVAALGRQPHFIDPIPQGAQIAHDGQLCFLGLTPKIPVQVSNQTRGVKQPKSERSSLQPVVLATYPYQSPPPHRTFKLKGTITNRQVEPSSPEQTLPGK